MKSGSECILLSTELVNAPVTVLIGGKCLYGGMAHVHNLFLVFWYMYFCSVLCDGSLKLPKEYQLELLGMSEGAILKGSLG